MVTSVTALCRSGLRDWLVQRITAIVIALYFLFILSYFVCHRSLDYVAWHQLFSCQMVKVSTFLALLSILAHTWIGMWTVFTDYIKPRDWRLIIICLMALLLLGYLGLGIEIIWGL